MTPKQKILYLLAGVCIGILIACIIITLDTPQPIIENRVSEQMDYSTIPQHSPYYEFFEWNESDYNYEVSNETFDGYAVIYGGGGGGVGGEGYNYINISPPPNLEEDDRILFIDLNSGIGHPGGKYKTSSNIPGLEEGYGGQSKSDEIDYTRSNISSSVKPTGGSGVGSGDMRLVVGNGGRIGNEANKNQSYNITNVYDARMYYIQKKDNSTSIGGGGGHLSFKHVSDCHRNITPMKQTDIETLCMYNGHTCYDLFWRVDFRPNLL